MAFFIFFRYSLGSLNKVALDRMVTESPSKKRLMTDSLWGFGFVCVGSILASLFS